VEVGDKKANVVSLPNKSNINMLPNKEQPSLFPFLGWGMGWVDSWSKININQQLLIPLITPFPLLQVLPAGTSL